MSRPRPRRLADAANCFSDRQFPRLLAGDSGLSTLQDQIYQSVRQLILSGTFAFGCRLPSSRALAKQLGVSRGSVSLAIERLGADGWLVSRRGSGTFVAYRGRHVVASPIGAFDPNPVPFALGVPPVDVFPKAVWSRLQSQRWRAMPSAHLQEGRATGWPGLQQAIAGYLAAWRGLSVAPAQIVISTCIPALIDLLVRALELSRCEAWVESPSYPAWWRTLRNCDVAIRGVPVDRFGMDVAAAMRTAPHAKLALISPNCQFPTGVAMSETRRHDLLEWATTHDGWVVEDDFDWQQAGSAAPRPLLTMNPERVIYCDTFNQVMFPALRIAYAVIPLLLLDRVVAARKGIDGSMNVPDQMILADFIAGGHLDRHMDRLRACRTERRATLQRLLDEELSEILEPAASVGAHIICRPRVPLSQLLAGCRRAGIVVENMADFRLLFEQSDQVMLGYFGYAAEALARAAARLRKTQLSSGGRISAPP